MKIFRAWFLVLMLMESTYSAASTVLQVDFAEVVLKSEVVFQGQVISSKVRSAAGGQLLTFVSFRVDDLLKGEYDLPTIELGFLGGKIGSLTMKIADLQMPKIGEEGVYFVESISRPLVNPLYGWHQGHYLVKTDSYGHKTIEKVSSDAEFNANYGAAKTANYQPQSLTNDLEDFKLRIINLLNQ